MKEKKEKKEKNCTEFTQNNKRDKRPGQSEAVWHAHDTRCQFEREDNKQTNKQKKKKKKKKQVALQFAIAVHMSAETTWAVFQSQRKHVDSWAGYKPRNDQDSSTHRISQREPRVEEAVRLDTSEPFELVSTSQGLWNRAKRPPKQKIQRC